MQKVRLSDIRIAFSHSHISHITSPARHFRLFILSFFFSFLPEPSIIHVILLNRTLRILCLLGIFCTLIPIADYFYFYSSQIVEHQTDDSGTSICSHYPIYQIPCGVEVSRIFLHILIVSSFTCGCFDCCKSSPITS